MFKTKCWFKKTFKSRLKFLTNKLIKLMNNCLNLKFLMKFQERNYKHYKKEINLLLPDSSSNVFHLNKLIKCFSILNLKYQKNQMV